MAYLQNHDKNICDRCEEKPIKWKLPFLYLDRNDKIHPNLGNDYHQYGVCEECKEVQSRILKAQGKDHWNKNWMRWE